MGPNFFTYSDRARPVLPYGTIFLGLRAPNQTRTPPGHPSRHVLIPYLRGEQVPWDQISYIFLQSASSSTLWHNFFGLARFQPNPDPTRPPRQSASSFTLWYIFFGLARFQQNPDPTRPPLQACVDPIFTGRAGPLVPNFLHILTECVQFYLIAHFLSSSASNQTRSPPGHLSRHVLIPYLRGEQVPWDQIFYIF